MNRVKRGILLSASLLMVGFLYVLTQPIPNAEAATVPFRVTVQDSLRVVITDHIQLGIIPDGQPHIQRDAITAIVDSNNGHYFYTKTESPDLINESDGETKINGIITNDDLFLKPELLPMNSWGITSKYTTCENCSLSSEKNSLTLDNYNLILNTSRAGKMYYSFAIGARIDDTIPSGRYSTTMNFVVIPAVVADSIQNARYMQQMSATVAATMTEGEYYKLMDIRDEKEYYVTKRGSDVIMMQNLDYSSNKYRNDAGVKDRVSTDYNDSVYVSGENKYRDDEGNETINNEAPLTPEEANMKAGGYYSYAAAIDKTKDLTSYTGLMQQSICPSPWRLPTYSEAARANSDASNLLWSNSNGYVTIGNDLQLTNNQYYWTNEIDRYNLKKATVYSPGSGQREYMDVRSLASIRCKFSAVITYTINVRYSNGNLYTSYTYTNSGEQLNQYIRSYSNVAGYSYKPNATTPDPDLHSMKIMERYSDSYVDIVDPTIIAEETNLYFVFKPSCNPGATTIEAAVCMQDMNSDVRKSMVTNQQYQLIDSRDNNKYWIAKLADGKVYMTQDLNFYAKRIITSAEDSGVGYSTTAVLRDLSFYTYARVQEGYYMKDGITKTSIAEQTTEEEKHHNTSKYYNSVGDTVCPGKWYVADPVDMLKNIGIDMESGNTITNNPEHNGEEGYTYDSTLTGEKLFGAPLYLGLSGMASELGVRAQGYRGAYSVDLNNALVFTYEDNMLQIEKIGKSYDYSYYPVRCVSDPSGLNEITYMQDASPLTVRNTGAGTQKQLIDKRDGKKYWVKKVGEYLVMEQNLNFEIPTTGIKIPEGSMQSGNYIESSRSNVYLDETSAIRYYNAGDRYVSDGQILSAEDLPEDSELRKNVIGGLYSFTAFTGGRVNGTAARPAICPKGWTWQGEKYVVERYRTANRLSSNDHTALKLYYWGPYSMPTATLTRTNNAYAYVSNGQIDVRTTNSATFLQKGTWTSSTIYPIRCILWKNGIYYNIESDYD